MSDVMRTNLSGHERAILLVLAENSGRTTGQIAEAIILAQPTLGNTNRSHSAAVRQFLLDLQRGGLVGELDDQKPVCWVRTKLGTKALNTGR